MPKGKTEGKRRDRKYPKKREKEKREKEKREKEKRELPRIVKRNEGI